MIFNYFLLLPALVLFWLPRQAFRFGKDLLKEGPTKSSANEDPRKTRSPGDISLRFSEEILKPRNYLEFLRALAGGYLLFGTYAFGAAISTYPLATAAMNRDVLLVRGIVLIVAVILQTLRFDGRQRFFPPVFFLTGIAFALAGPKAAGFAIVLTWLVNRSIPSPVGFFMAFAVILAGFGFVFDGKSLTMFLACALQIIPSAMSLLLGRPLVAISRRTPRAEARA